MMEILKRWAPALIGVVLVGIYIPAAIYAIPYSGWILAIGLFAIVGSL